MLKKITIAKMLIAMAPYLATRRANPIAERKSCN